MVDILFFGSGFLIMFFYAKVLHPFRSSVMVWLVGWLVGFLWNINLCNLFNAKSISYVNNQFYFKEFSLAYIDFTSI